MSDKENQTEEFDFDDLENESPDISIDDGIKENEEKNNNLNQNENQNQSENDDEVEIEVDEDDLEADNSESIATDSNIADPAKINPQDENRDFFMPGMESANFNKDNFNKDNFNIDDDDISIENNDGETENNSADNKELDENEAANAEKQQNNLVEKAKEFWQKNKIGVLIGTAALAGLVGFKMFLNQEKTMPEISTTPSTIKIIKPQQANSNVSQNNSNANIENNVGNKQINSNPMDDIDDIENQALEKLNNNKNVNKDLDLTKNVTKRNFFDDNLLDNSTDNKNSQTKIDELYKENQKLKQQLEQLNKGQETKQITKKSTSNVVSSKKMYYSIRSIRYGKAWVDIGAGKVIIVQGGDMLPNGARVQSISASCVNTNKGQFCSH